VGNICGQFRISGYGTKDAEAVRSTHISRIIRIAGCRQFTSLQESGSVPLDRDIPIGARKSSGQVYRITQGNNPHLRDHRGRRSPRRH